VIYEKDQSGAITKYVYANGMRIARITSTGAVQYFLADHVGSTRKIISGDASRTELYSVDYEPFGKPYVTSGTQPDPYKFTGEKKDDPTGLEYLRARQYDPEIGRVVSADPVRGSLSRPQTQNRYAYVANNPLRWLDPSGQFFEDIDWASVGALLAGAAVMAGVIALCATGVGCIGVILAFAIAGAVGAGTAVAVTAAQGRPVGLDTAVNGALFGLTGASLVYGAAGAGVFGSAAAQATSTMEAISTGTLAAISESLFGRQKSASAEPVPNGHPQIAPEERMNPYEEAVYRELQRGGGRVVFEPKGQMGPDFFVEGGYYGGSKGGYYEATEWASYNDLGQLSRLDDYRLRGYSVGFFYEGAQPDFAYAVARFPEVPLKPFWRG